MDVQRGGRTQQYLDPIKKPPKQRAFAVFDLESKDGDSQRPGFTRPFMVGFYEGQKFISFRNEPRVQKLAWYERAISPGGCIDKFMRHILGSDPRVEAPFRDMDIYAHNMGSFDGLFLPAWLERNNHWVSYKIMPVQSRIQAIEIWKYNKNRYRATPDARKKANGQDRKQFGVVRILDSFRILPVSLDKIAIAFGLTGKLKRVGDQEFDLKLHEDDPMWEAYNEVDCIQLFEVVAKYQQLIGELGGEVGITAPSTAIKLLRRKYLSEDIRVHRNIHFERCKAEESCDGCAHAFFRSAYFGGRTEIYARKGTGWYYDVNSSYPFSMTKPQPVGEMYELGENEDFTRFARNPYEYVGFVRCTVEIPEDTYLPPLPVQHGGKLKFPAGTFSGTWDWIELRALQRVGGRILHVEKSVWLRAHAFLAGYVNDLYAMRKDNSPQYKGKALSEVAKLVLNSTSGKLGMDQNRVEMIILKPGEDEPWEARYPGESDDHRDKRKRAEREGKHDFKVSIPLPGEPVDAFEKRKKAEKKGERVPLQASEWRLTELPVASGIYEHDSLVRVRDIRVDAAYIIPQVAAHITTSSRNLLWSFAMDILDRCQRCQKCKKPFVEHLICAKCGQSVVDHIDPDFEIPGRQRLACLDFKSDCPEPSLCPYTRQQHEEGLVSDCQFEPHDIYYSDTDSLITSYRDYPESKELGALKKEFAEPITIESFAPKMYRMSKPTPFDGNHIRGRTCPLTCEGCMEDFQGKIMKGEHKFPKLCMQKCPGCLKEGKKLVKGKHALKPTGERDCDRKCPGCSCEKIMMKGVPKEMRTIETIERLIVKREELKYHQHEKLGSLAKTGFRRTPFLQEVKKSMKSKYDKRIMDDVTGETKPIVLIGEEYLSVRFKQSASKPDYAIPQWLVKVLIPD